MSQRRVILGEKEGLSYRRCHQLRTQFPHCRSQMSRITLIHLHDVIILQQGGQIYGHKPTTLSVSFCQRTRRYHRDTLDGANSLSWKNLRSTLTLPLLHLIVILLL